MKPVGTNQMVLFLALVLFSFAKDDKHGSLPADF